MENLSSQYAIWVAPVYALVNLANREVSCNIIIDAYEKFGNHDCSTVGLQLTRKGMDADAIEKKCYDCLYEIKCGLVM